MRNKRNKKDIRKNITIERYLEVREALSYIKHNLEVRDMLYNEEKRR